MIQGTYYIQDIVCYILLHRVDYVKMNLSKFILSSTVLENFFGVINLRSFSLQWLCTNDRLI